MIGENEREGARLLARADKQLTHAQQGLARAVADIRQLRTEYDGDTQAWAVLGVRIAGQLDCTTAAQQYAVEMHVAAALRLADDDRGPQ